MKTAEEIIRVIAKSKQLTALLEEYKQALEIEKCEYVIRECSDGRNWELIDANQHERLSICFTMRNNAAHPGEATITEPNLLSAFSDLKTIVFDNPKFKL